MNWYKKISEIIQPGKTISPDPTIWSQEGQYFEAIRLNDGTIIYDPHYNHWEIFFRYEYEIGVIDNIESIGKIEEDGVYTKFRTTEDSRQYFQTSYRTDRIY